MNKISAVYKITNKITGECYVGSSKNVYSRWANHKCPSTWKKHLNNRMYQDMQKYGVEQFYFEIIVPAAPTHLKICEQEFIDIYHPTYNNNRANTGIDTSDMNEYRKQLQKQYREEHREEFNEYHRQYLQANKEYNEEHREYCRKWAKEHRDYFRNYYKQHKQSKLYTGEIER